MSESLPSPADARWPTAFRRGVEPLFVLARGRKLAYANPAWGTTNMIITISSFLIAFSVLLFLINVIRSWSGGEVAGDDPWQANTLEWATTSPPPPYNFEKVAPVHSYMPLRDLREAGGLPPVTVPASTG